MLANSLQFGGLDQFSFLDGRVVEQRQQLRSIKRNKSQTRSAKVGSVLDLLSQVRFDHGKKVQSCQDKFPTRGAIHISMLIEMPIINYDRVYNFCRFENRKSRMLL